MDRPLSLHSFPRAILHIDGDAFFASCEQAADPKLRRKPVVTGLERGIASSMSYEAKALGVTRGMPVREIRRICPECVILPSDYETYGLMSLRMYADTADRGQREADLTQRDNGPVARLHAVHELQEVARAAAGVTVPQALGQLHRAAGVLVSMERAGNAGLVAMADRLDAVVGEHGAEVAAGSFA